MDSVGQSHERIVEILREALPEVRTVYLFGSTATGEARRDSDVDLAVLASRPLGPEERWGLQERLAAEYHRDVDLVDLRSASTVMRKQVVATGKVLLDTDPAGREAFEAYVLSSYARLNEERRAILDDVAQRGTIHG